VIRRGITVGLKHSAQLGSPDIENRLNPSAGAKSPGLIQKVGDRSIGTNAGVFDRRAFRFNRSWRSCKRDSARECKYGVKGRSRETRSGETAGGGHAGDI
jgi:hypothetical protein